MGADNPCLGTTASALQGKELLVNQKHVKIWQAFLGAARQPSSSKPVNPCHLNIPSVTDRPGHDIVGRWTA